MKRLLLLVLVQAILAGCLPAPVEQDVFVNLASVRIAVPVPSTPEQLPSQSIAGAQSILDGNPSENLFVGEAGSRVKAAEVLVEANRARALDQVTKRLRANKLKAAEQERAKLQADLDQQLLAIDDAALVKLRAELDRHVAKKGPRVFELAAKAGFPEGTRVSQRFIRRRAELLPKNSAVIAEIREKIIDLDASYLAAREQILNVSRKESEEAQASYTLKVARMLNEAQAEAQAEAKAAINARAVEVDKKALLALNVTLPKSEAARMNLPSTSLSPGRINSHVNLSVLPPEEVKSALEVWLATRHYRLVKRSQTSARDATSEFKQWLQNNHRGLLAN
ncbi:MAG: hypothetical protein K8R88_12215 [Armatimonadetes bacterium]|nr:hypothetical protein [Armatimonadota bacterium]